MADVAQRLVGDRPATRGFYGNGGGVARDNLVIGIAGGGNERWPGWDAPGGERRRTGMGKRQKERERERT